MSSLTKPIVSVKGLVKDFPSSGSAGKDKTIRALNDVSFDMFAGEALAIVGESGSGKSTIARILSLLHPKTSGELLFNDSEISSYSRKQKRAYRERAQMIFQDPYGSLNPVHTIYHHLARPLKIHKKVRGKKELDDKIHALLEEVGLVPAIETAKKYPFELSGGQRQRVCIAKTLAIGADVVFADEPTSALDVSIRLGILNLMEKMKKEHKVSFMYITHDLATARYFAERTAVMYVGHMVEWGETEDIIQSPQHPYTQLLISAVPDPLKRNRKDTAVTEIKNKDIPTWTASSKGCPFVSRCTKVMDKCSESMPEVSKISEKHFVRCHLHSTL